MVQWLVAIDHLIVHQTRVIFWCKHIQLYSTIIYLPSYPKNNPRYVHCISPFHHHSMNEKDHVSFNYLPDHHHIIDDINPTSRSSRKKSLFPNNKKNPMTQFTIYSTFYAWFTPKNSYLPRSTHDNHGLSHGLINVMHHHASQTMAIETSWVSVNLIDGLMTTPSPVTCESYHGGTRSWHICRWGPQTWTLCWATAPTKSTEKP